jgi:uncharacterized protein
MTHTSEISGATAAPAERQDSLSVYFLVGVFLGIIFLKSEVASWFRIQEMFRFQSIHMYGIIGLAVAVGAVSVALMKRFGVRTIRGEEIAWPDAASMRPQPHHILGGTVFGLGWGLAGACPGPLFALVGSGLPVVLVALLSAVAGAWVYGLLKPRLPH